MEEGEDVSSSPPAEVAAGRGWEGGASPADTVPRPWENIPCDPLEEKRPGRGPLAPVGGALPVDFSDRGGGLSEVSCPLWTESGGGDSAVRDGWSWCGSSPGSRTFPMNACSGTCELCRCAVTGVVSFEKLSSMMSSPFNRGVLEESSGLSDGVASRESPVKEESSRLWLFNVLSGERKGDPSMDWCGLLSKRDDESGDGLPGIWFSLGGDDSESIVTMRDGSRFWFDCE